MVCDLCGQPAPDEPHKASPDAVRRAHLNPGTVHEYLAPVYHCVPCELGFCGPQCALTHYQEKHDRA